MDLHLDLHEQEPKHISVLEERLRRALLTRKEDEGQYYKPNGSSSARIHELCLKRGTEKGETNFMRLHKQIPMCYTSSLEDFLTQNQ